MGGGEDSEKSAVAAAWGVWLTGPDLFQRSCCLIRCPSYSGVQQGIGRDVGVIHRRDLREPPTVWVPDRSGPSTRSFRADVRGPSAARLISLSFIKITKMIEVYIAPWRQQQIM